MLTNFPAFVHQAFVPWCLMHHIAIYSPLPTIIEPTYRPGKRDDNVHELAKRKSFLNINFNGNFMNIRFFRITLTTCVVMLGTNSTLAADTKIISPQTTASQPQAKRMSEASSKPKIKLIDINSAKKAEIKTLPGVGDSEADKIIAGRPYGSKAHLLTLNVVSAEVYEGLKGLVIAKQPTNDAAKNAALYKNKK